jgi:hypothetical protein
MRIALSVVGVLLAFSTGCGDGGGSGGGFEAVTPIVTGGGGNDDIDVFTEVPRAAAASGAVDLATEAATNVILDPLTGGEATGAPHVFLAPAEFEFTAHIEKEIDLDSEGRSGNDRFPNVSGTLLITVDGSLQGTWLSGEATYSVMVEAGTDIAAVDPGTEIEVLIPEGASWSFSLAVTWEVTDSQNWVVIAVATKTVDLDGLVVTDGEVETTVSITGGREITTGIARVEGQIVKEREIEGSFTIVIDDGEDSVTLEIGFDEDGLIVVTIGDEEFGPFTRQEFREFFGTQFA